jgi:two-component system chemotaxis response regulator CheY
MAIKILILDDSLVMAKVVKRALSMCRLGEATYYQARTYHEGLAILKQNQIELAMIDLNMPGIVAANSFLEIKKLQGINNIKVMALASLCSQASEDELRDQNILLVPKPFTPELLASKLKQLF